MPSDLFTGMLYGPQGPETRRVGDDTWGPKLEQAFAGNDDENFIEKTRIIGKYTFAWGTFFAMGDIILLNNRGGLPVALQRLKYHYVPWLGCTVAYTAAVHAASSFRGKTDQTNHIVGGFAAGAVLGRCARHFLTGALTGAFFAFLGWCYKDSAMKGYLLMGDLDNTTPKHGNPFSHKLDFTQFRKWHGARPGYWARTPEEAEEVFKRGQLSDGNTTDRLW